MVEGVSDELASLYLHLLRKAGGRNRRHIARCLEAVSNGVWCDACRGSALRDWPSTAMGSGVGGNSITTGPCPGQASSAIGSNCPVWLHMKAEEVEAPTAIQGTAHSRTRAHDGTIYYLAEGWDHIAPYRLNESGLWEFVYIDHADWAVARSFVADLHESDDCRLAARPKEVSG